MSIDNQEEIISLLTAKGYQVTENLIQEIHFVNISKNRKLIIRGKDGQFQYVVHVEQTFHSENINELLKDLESEV